MKTALSSREITHTLCTVSTSILLCTSMETQAAPPENQPETWYQENPISIGFLPSGNLLAPGAMTDSSAHQPGLDFFNKTSTPITNDTEQPALARPFGQGEVRNLDPLQSAALSTFLIGPAMFTSRSAGGQTQRAGLFVGNSRLSGTPESFTAGPVAPRGDHQNLEGKSLGAYWSLIGAQGWHVDLMAVGTRLNGYTRDDQGTRLATEGNAVTLSVEGGFPIGLSENWVIEPQAQLVNQRVSLDSQSSGAASNTSDDLSSWSGRVGARLKGSYELRGLPVEPYVRTNLWHTFSSGETLSLDQVEKINGRNSSSSVELGLGLVARVSQTVSVYVSADYSGSFDDDDLNGVIGSLGVRMRW